MAAPRIRTDHDRLVQIASSFGRQAQHAQQSVQRIQLQVDQLQGGDWIGRGAKAFYAEMDQEVLPALKRLTDALAQAQRTTIQISQVLQQAEEDASRLLRVILGGDGRGAAGVGGVFDAGGFFGDLGGLVGVASGVLNGLAGLVTTPVWSAHAHLMADIFAQGGEAALLRTGIAPIVANWQSLDSTVQSWGNRLTSIGAGLTGLGQRMNSSADTLVGKIISGTLAGGASYGTGQSPWATTPWAAGSAFMKHNGYYFAADTAIWGLNSTFGTNIDRPSAIVNTAIDNIVTTTEGFVTGSSEGWARIHQRNLSGQNTWVFQKAAEAGEFYAEHGVVGPLKEIGKEIGSAVLGVFGD